MSYRSQRIEEAGFEDLVRAVQDRMNDAVDQQARLRLLLDAVVAISADLSLDGVLARIVAIASRLAGARYAALGVLAPSGGQRLRTFVHHGITDADAAVIGDLPTGHGILGLIIDRPEPLRLHDIAQHPASYGFPPNHPPMTSFLGVPVRIRDRVFGNLYLTEKVGGGDFSADDQEIVVALASAAGVAIENARLYEDLRSREAWLVATAEVVAALSDPGSGAGVTTIAARAREVAGADAAWVCAQAEAPMVLAAVGDLPTVPEDDALAAVLDIAHRVAVDAEPSEPAVRDDAVAPLVAVRLDPTASGRGALVLGWAPHHDAADAAGFVDGTDRPLANFAEQTALALQLAETREDRQRLALLEDRDRIGRDLHDLVIQRLFAVGLGLQGVSRRVGPPEVVARIEQAVDDLDATIKDIRRAIFGLGVLDTDGDVQAEVTRLVDRAAATLKFRPSLRFEGPVRTLVDPDVVPDLLAVLAEGLSNASRHSGARTVEVIVAAGDDVVLTVGDDGRGIDPEAVESGLANIRRRAEQRGGTLEITSAPERGTRLVWRVPRR
ncbi:GAF domain-containing protein [Nocardioides sp.]|uniref:GAF domain-containing sensor histidine kinase n=1 Tax=Nocardioides sp. TaxID=35761 RepID=UPI0035139126